jgi:hypothetical protein
MAPNGLVTDFCQAEKSLLFKVIRELNKGKHMCLIHIYNQIQVVSDQFNLCYICFIINDSKTVISIQRDCMPISLQLCNTK